MTCQRYIEVNGVMYVVDWTCKKFFETLDCEICRGYLLDTKQDLSIDRMFYYFKAENNSESPYGRLSIPSDSCLQHFKEVESIVRSLIDKALLGSKVSQHLVSHLHGHTFMKALQLYSTQLISTMYLMYVRTKN